MSIQSTMTSPSPPGLTEIVAALRRRRGRIFVIAGLILASFIVLAFVLPPVYRSTATILIEEQDIPSDLVRSTITSYADQRIQVISQRVMTRANLNAIIDKYGLYPDERRSLTPEEVLDEMRDDIHLEMVSADVIDPRSGRPTQATIAFSLSYDSEDPESAQRVTNELVSLYLTENLRNRTRKAEEATDFLANDARRLHERLTAVEARLADFKERNIGRLPELMNMNLQLLDRAERELQSVDAQIASQEERTIYLQGQLAQMDPNMPLGGNASESMLDPATRLRLLEVRLVGLKAHYAVDHPDVIKAEKEIQALRDQLGIVGGDDRSGASRLELARLRTELNLAREHYSDEHPDVKRLRQQIAKLEAGLGDDAGAVPVSAGQGDGGAEGQGIVASNPAYITLAAQLEAARSQLKALRAQRRSLKKKMADYESRLLRTPEAEREYQNLSRERENILRSYQEAQAKLTQARVAQELEEERKGERFSLVEPPLLPEKPIKPNRLALVFLGLVLSIGGGLGYGIVAQNLDRSVRGADMLESITGRPALTSVPYLETEAERSAHRRRRMLSIIGLIGIVAVVLAILHVYWKPLDVVWFILMRRLGLDA